MNIRTAEISDLEEISIFIKKLSDLHYEVRNNTFKLKELKSIKEYVKTVIDDKQVKVVVAQEDTILCRSNYL